MKTVLFFYYDVLLKRSICDAYITPETNVRELINWRSKCMGQDIKNGYYTSMTIQIVDKIDVTMHNI